MSKSLGNLYVLDDILERGHSPGAPLPATFGHYRQPLNFTWGPLLRQRVRCRDCLDDSRVDVDTLVNMDYRCLETNVFESALQALWRSQHASSGGAEL